MNSTPDENNFIRKDTEQSYWDGSLEKSELLRRQQEAEEKEKRKKKVKRREVEKKKSETLDSKDSVVTASQRSVSSMTTKKTTMVPGANRPVRPHSIVSGKPDFTKLPEQEGCFSFCQMPKNIQDIIRNVPLGTQYSESFKLKIAETPFHSGNGRLAYNGLIVSSYQDFEGNTNRATPNIVLKEYQNSELNSPSRYEQSNQLQTIAAFLANGFTKELKRNTSTPYQLKFSKSRTLKVTSATGNRFMSSEKHYKKDELFFRFTTSAIPHVVPVKAKAREKEIPTDLLHQVLAFSHWTYQVTKGYLMVVDLQGIVNLRDVSNMNVVLTDPAIHCTDITRFGTRNLGKKGMNEFFNNHKCNSVCVDMNLNKPQGTLNWWEGNKKRNYRSIYEDEGLQYGEDVNDIQELTARQQCATSLKQKRINQVFNSITLARSLQLCFLVDGTGSMDPHIEGVKTLIHKIVTTLLQNDRDEEEIKDIELAIVVYRDYGDKNQIEYLDFTKSVDDFRKFCSTVRAGGGNDACEDVAGGLKKALEMNWFQQEKTKAIYHIADYPGHGHEVHDQHSTSYDRYLHFEPRGLQYKELFTELVSKGIHYYFGKITNKTDIMMTKFSELYGETVRAFDVNNPLDIKDSVVTASQMSVSSMITKSTMVPGANRPVRPHSIVSGKPDFTKLPENKGCFITYYFPTSITAIIDEIPLGKKLTKSSKFKIASFPFAKGSERLAYHGLDLSSYHIKNGNTEGEIKHKSEEIVLKEYLHRGPGMNSASRYEQSNQLQTIAAFLAIEFMKELKRNTSTPYQLKFLKSRTLSAASATGNRFMSCETLYKKNDPFVRFTTNVGHVISAAKAREKEIPTDLLHQVLAFSHWTYQVTKGYLMVVDLQGIVNLRDVSNMNVVLTDPAIHCTDITRFGRTNYGEKGMRSFFDTHKCNSVCVDMNLNKPRV